MYPNDSNALEEYRNLIEVIGQTISDYPQQLNVPRAILLINWMSGNRCRILFVKVMILIKGMVITKTSSCYQRGYGKR